MKANLTMALLCALAALLMTAPIVAADDSVGPSSAPTSSLCEVFYYSIDPPGYQVDPSCLKSPVFDNSP